MDVVSFLIDTNAGVENVLTQDGEAIHMAAWVGKPAMIKMLLDRGCELNASTSNFDIDYRGNATKAREKQPTTVAKIPWGYQQEYQEYTPLDIFGRFCPFKGQKEGYANMSETYVMLEGLGAFRHGVDHLRNCLVYFTPDGGQLALDSEEGRKARELSLEENP